MPSLESSIDQLYKEPLAGFIAARTALAKTLKGEDAQRVKRLEKPTVVPWAVNQLYWHARPVYERLLKSGAALRAAQIAALGGKTANVPGAAETHRKAIADAVAEAGRLAAAGEANPGAEALSQTLEVLSLAATPPETPGRLSKPLRPAGFEALAGVTVKALPPVRLRTEAAHEKKAAVEKAPGPRLVADARAREREEAAERQRQAEIKKAEAALARAQSAEAAAREEWQRRKRELETAEKDLARLK